MNINAHGLIVRPGDSLLISFAERISDAEFEELQQELSDRLPGLDKIVVFENVTAMAVYRPDPAVPS